MILHHLKSFEKQLLQIKNNWIPVNFYKLLIRLEETMPKDFDTLLR